MAPVLPADMKIKNLFCADCFFQAVLDSAGFAVVATDADGYLIYINDLARTLLDFRDDIRTRKIHYADVDYTTWLDFKKIISTGEAQIGVPVTSFSGLLVANRSPITLNGENIGVISVFHEPECHEDFSEYLQKRESAAGCSLKDRLKRIEGEIIADAVRKCGNARRAAMHLKVNPSTICRKLGTRSTALK